MSKGEVRLVWHGAQVQAEVDALLRNKLLLAGEMLRTQVVKNISDSTTAHGPSKPGEFPHADEGTLRKSIFARLVDNGTAVIVGTALKYGRWLEFGTRKMAARPFLRPTFYKMMPKIQRIWSLLGHRKQDQK